MRLPKSHYFKNRKSFEFWLSRNHSRSNGIWLRSYRKGFGGDALKGTEVLDPLLCYGWITGPVRKGTDEYTLWWVCPRRRNSLWSKINTGHAERLIKEKRMKPSGMREILEAKKDGRWRRAYAPQREAKLPRDFVIMVRKNSTASATLNGLNRQKVYSIIFRLHNTRNRELRKRKIIKIIGMLGKGSFQ